MVTNNLEQYDRKYPRSMEDWEFLFGEVTYPEPLPCCGSTSLHKAECPYVRLVKASGNRIQTQPPEEDFI